MVELPGGAPLLATIFHHASRLRGAAAFHPRGVVFRATWLPDPQGDVLGGSPLLGGPRGALLRLSHGIGLPPRAPDILGLALKILDIYGPGRDQDLLFASTGRHRWTRRLLRPARDYTQVTLSTILPYQVDGHRAPLVVHVGPTANTASYAEILRTGPNAVPLFNLYLGDTTGPRIGRFVTCDDTPSGVDDALRFDPWNTGPELRPAGRLNRLRRPTYEASQDGRGAPRVASQHRRSVEHGAPVEAGRSEPSARATRLSVG